MKALQRILLLLFCSPAMTADYFVDNVTGNDAWNGRECITFDTGTAMSAGYTAATLTLVDAAPVFDDYVADGFRAGDVVYCSHASIDDGWYPIASITSNTTIVLAAALTLNDVAAGNLTTVVGIAVAGDDGPFATIGAFTLAAVQAPGDRVFIRNGSDYILEDNALQDGTIAAIIAIKEVGTEQATVQFFGWNTSFTDDITYVHSSTGVAYTYAERQATRAKLNADTNDFEHVLTSALNTNLYVSFWNFWLLADPSVDGSETVNLPANNHVEMVNCKLEGGQADHRFDQESTLIGCEIVGGRHLVLDSNGYVAYCTMTGMGDGVQLGSWGVIDHCISYNNTTSQFRFGKQGDGGVLTNSIAWGNKAVNTTVIGVQIVQVSTTVDPDRVHMANNMIVDCAEGLITSWEASGRGHALGVNNLFYGNTANYGNSGAGNDAFWPELFTITTLDPQFADPINGDFTIGNAKIGYNGFSIMDFVTGIVSHETVGAVSPDRGSSIIGG